MLQQYSQFSYYIFYFKILFFLSSYLVIFQASSMKIANTQKQYQRCRIQILQQYCSRYKKRINNQKSNFTNPVTSLITTSLIPKNSFDKRIKYTPRKVVTKRENFKRQKISITNLQLEEKWYMEDIPKNQYHRKRTNIKSVYNYCVANTPEKNITHSISGIQTIHFTSYAIQFAENVSVQKHQFTKETEQCYQKEAENIKPQATCRTLHRILSPKNIKPKIQSKMIMNKRPKSSIKFGRYEQKIRRKALVQWNSQQKAQSQVKGWQAGQRQEYDF